MKTFYFTREQRDALLSGVDNLTHKAALELGFATGCRVGEITTIRLEDVKFDRGWVLVPDSKKRVKRVVPVSKRVLNVVKMYVEERGLKPLDRLFPYSNVTMNNWLRKYASKTGIEPGKEEGNLRWHSVRGSFIRWHQDLPVKAMEQVTGDKYETLNEYYMDYRPEDLKRLFDDD